MDTDFGRHAYCVALKHRIFTGFSDCRCDRTQCVPPRYRHVSRKFPRAVMPDEMQQGSAPVFRSGVMGNCGKPRAHLPCAPLMERARLDIAQHLRCVGCLRNEHRRRASGGIARRCLGNRLTSETATPAYGNLRRGHRLGRRLRAGFAEMIAIIGPAVCGLLAQGTT